MSQKKTYVISYHYITGTYLDWIQQRISDKFTGAPIKSKAVRYIYFTK